MKIIIAAAAAVSALALAGAACAQEIPQGLYGNIGYSYYDGDRINLGGPLARVGWQSSTPLGVEVEGGIGTDKDTGGKYGPSAIRAQLQHEWGAYVTGSGKIGESFEAIVRFGYGSQNIKFTPAATYTGPAFGAYQQNFKSWNYGVAGQFIYDGQNGIRVDYTRMNFRDNGIKDDNTYTVSYVRKFGAPAKK